jgi:hypothetical protein
MVLLRAGIVVTSVGHAGRHIPQARKISETWRKERCFAIFTARAAEVEWMQESSLADIYHPVGERPGLLWREEPLLVR